MIEGPYYAPARHGLTIVYEDDRGWSWEFDKFVVWRSINGTLFFATDSGCSCPSPFEDVSSVEELEQVENNDVEKIIAAYQSWVRDRDRSDEGQGSDTQPLRAALAKEGA